MEDKTVWIVCNNDPTKYPMYILRVYQTKDSALRFMGQYVTELNNSTYTGYLSIYEKKLGNSDDIAMLGVNNEQKL